MREAQEEDRRLETLSLTSVGQEAFDDLYMEAARFDEDLLQAFSDQERRVLRKCLGAIAEI